MRHDPILARREFKSPHNNPPMVYFVEGGLNYIKGNSIPYFSLTSTTHRKGFPNQCFSGGCDHENIIKHFPRFAELAKMHLSGMDGIPLHGNENGFYWLAGCVEGGFGQEYTGASGEYGRSKEECLRIFADHCRISQEQATQIIGIVSLSFYPKDTWGRIFDSMIPRFNAEAKSAIKKYGLIIYGDVWEGIAEIKALVNGNGSLKEGK